MLSAFAVLKQKINSLGMAYLPSLFSKQVYKHFLQNAFWSVAGAIALRGQIIVISILLSRLLPVETFGQLGLLRSTIATFAIFATLGISLGSTKFIAVSIAKGGKQINSWINFSYLLTAITALLCGMLIFFFSTSLSSSLLNDLQFSSYLKASAVIIALTTLLSTQIGVLNGFQSFKKVAVLNVYGMLLGLPLQVALAYQFGIYGFLAGTALSTILQIVLYEFTIQKLKKNYEVHENRYLNKTEKRAFLNFCIPAALSGFLVTPVSWYCNTVLVRSNDGYSQMAYFEIANNWRMMLLFLPATISQVLLPNIASLNEKVKLRKLLYLNIAINGGIAIMAIAGFILCSTALLNLYGQQYESGTTAFNILITSTFFVAVANVTGQLIAGKMKMWYGFLLNAIWALLIIVFSHYFIQQRALGAAGLALAYFCSYAVHTVLQAIVFWYYFHSWKDTSVAHNAVVHEQQELVSS